MPQTVCRHVTVFLLRSYRNTHTHTYISFNPSLRLSLSLVESTFKSGLGLGLQRAHVRSATLRLYSCLSLYLFPFRRRCHFELVKRARTSAKQRQPSSSPLYPASLLTSSLVCTGPAVILRSNICVYSAGTHAS